MRGAISCEGRVVVKAWLASRSSYRRCEDILSVFEVHASGVDCLFFSSRGSALTTRTLAAACKLVSTRLAPAASWEEWRFASTRDAQQCALTGLTHRLLTLLLTALKNTSVFINVIVYFFSC